MDEQSNRVAYEKLQTLELKENRWRYDIATFDGREWITITIYYTWDYLDIYEQGTRMPYEKL